MYRNLFFVAVGLIAGLILGAFGTYTAVKSKIGDSYEIVKPKVRGEGNTLRIDQENIKSVDNKQLKWKKNGKLKRKYRKNRIFSGVEGQE